MNVDANREPTAVTSGFLRGEGVLSDRAIAERLDAVVLASIAPIAIGLALLYLLFAAFHVKLLPPPHNLAMTAIAIGTSIVLVATAAHSRRPGLASRWGHPLAAFMIVLVMINSLLHLAITGNSYQTTNLMVLAIGMGSFVLSKRLLGYLTIALVGSWLCVAFVYANSMARTEWTHFGFALVTSISVGWLIFIVRRGNLVRVERLAWQHHQAMRRAQEGESRFYQLANATSEGVVIHNQGLIVDVNERLLEMFDAAEYEMIGRRVTELVSRKDRELLRAGALDKKHEARVTAVRGDGTHFPVAMRMRTLRMRDKELFVVAIRDLTESYEIGRLKDEFVATVSHELRTPLTSIRGALALLQPEQLVRHPHKAARLLRVANANIDRLLRLITDLLDLQRMESGKMPLELRECVTTELARAAVREMMPHAESANIRLENQVQPAVVTCDPDRIIQTLTNLINNAIKYSDKGSSIVVDCDVRDGEVLFRVRDEGPGIPPEKLELVFDRFLQLDGSDARRSGGAGLGLSICRTIITQHNGRIWAESSEKGSTFSFTLPVAAARAGSAISGGHT
jgi:PAS domain S-box-containing protein